MCAFILSERAMENEPKEIYYTVWKGHKTKSEKPNGDYWNTGENCIIFQNGTYHTCLKFIFFNLSDLDWIKNIF